MVTLYRFEKTDLIPLHPPLSKGGNLSPPFGKGRLPACAKPRLPEPRAAGRRFGEGRGGILQEKCIFPKMSNAGSPPAEPGVYLIANYFRNNRGSTALWFFRISKCR